MDNTTQKLSEALNTLIVAYEELQKENEGLNNTIKNLNNRIGELESKKTELETNVSSLNNDSQKQESDISSMLGKIESLLSIGKNNPQADEQKATEVKPQNVTVVKEEPASFGEKEEDSSSSNHQGNSKIDLNRMESLLSGLSKN